MSSERNIFDKLQKLKKETCLSNISKLLASFLKEIPEYIFTIKSSDPAQAGKVEEVFQELMRCIASAGIVHDFPVDENRSYTAADFYHLPETATLSFSCLISLCHQSLLNQCPAPDAHTLSTILLLCGSHHKKFLWTNKTSVVGSQELLSNLFKVFNANSLRDLIIHNEVTDKLIEHFKINLTKENWRRNPCTRQIYKWFLLQLKVYEVPSLLAILLPAALLCVDDHTTVNNLLGIQCLHHIILNVPPTVLSWQGRAEVVYDALHHLVYKKEPVVIQTLHPCMLDLLAGMEPDPNSIQRTIEKPSKYDDLFRNILLSMEMEQVIKLRSVYAQQLPLYIDRMGITILSHSKHLFLVVHEYLAVHDGPTEESRLNVLHALQLIIRVAWPRISNHCGSLLKSLLRLLYDFLINPPEVSENVKAEVITRATCCLTLLNKACPEKFQELTSELLTIHNVAEPVIEIIKRVRDFEESETSSCGV